MLEKFLDIVARLTGMVDRFTTMLDCVDVSFLPDGILDDLSTPSQIGATRVGGIDLQATHPGRPVRRPGPGRGSRRIHRGRPRRHGPLQAGLGKDEYTVRQAAYDLRKLRGKELVLKPGRTRRYQGPEQAARTIAALMILREKGLAPILAGIRQPGPGRPPKTYNRLDRDYDRLRKDMRVLFQDLAITTEAA